MIAILIVAAGIGLVFGAKGFSEQVLRVAAGLVLATSFMAAAVGSCTGLSRPGPSVSAGWVAPWALGGAGLALVGFIAWQRRRSARRNADGQRARVQQRQRALPPPPADGGEEL